MNYALIKFKTKRFTAILICLLFAFVQLEASAQQSSLITGKVVDEMGEAIIGASVVQKGTTIGTVTDEGGTFRLTVPANATILVSYLGFTTKEVLVNNQKNLFVRLMEDSKTLEEVVVVGYGTQKKVTLTGSIASVKSDEIVTTKNENVKNMLTGKVSGVRVTQNTSEPGAFNNAFDIRGFGNPLIVIDGIPRDNMDRMDPNDIESLTVLKDASAAVYGVRAANGVVLITTKKGTKGTFDIDYSGNYGTQVPSGLPEPVGPVDYMTLRNERTMHSIDNQKRIFSDSDIAAYADGSKRGTYWHDAVMKDYAPQTQHSLSATGGSEKITFFTSLGYLYQDGLLKSGDLNYEKFSLRSNITGKITDRLTVDVNLSGIMDQKNQPQVDPLWVIRTYWRQNPLQSVYANDTPDYYLYSWIEGDNPVAMQESDVVGYKKFINRWFQSSVNIKYQVPYIDGLQVRLMGSYDYRNAENTSYNKQYNLYTYDEAKQTYDTYSRQSPSTIRRNYYGYSTMLTQAALEYSKMFGSVHSINALLLFEQSQKRGDNFYAQRELSLPMDLLLTGDSQNQIGYMDSGVTIDNIYYPMPYDYTNQGLVGRFNYDYLSKYLMEFSFRYDGSSKFPSNSRWGFFPSASAGWRISEENFWKDSSALKFINNLKVRGSYGILGDDQAATYQFISGYSYPASGSNNTLPSGSVFGDKFINSSQNKGFANPDITWYTSKTLDIGFDFEAWQGLLGVTFDYFERNRDGLLATRAMSLPGVVGVGLPQENLNGDQTKGYDMELSHRNHIGEVKYSLKGIFSFARTMHKYVERSKAGNSYDNWRNNVNDRYSNIWWGYNGDGQFQNYDQIYSNPVYVGRGTLPGDYKYADWNNDGMISDLDKHPIGYTYGAELPLINYGLTLGLEYKGFDLNALFQGASLRNIPIEEQLRTPLWGNDNSNALTQFMDRWHPVDPNADPYHPSTQWASGSFAYTGTESYYDSEFNLENAAYLRLKSLEIGYTLPKSLVSKAGIKNVRVYVNGYNVFTITDVKYVDPEHPASSWGYMYPLNKTYSVGLNVKF